jgi:hypothetical protein
MLIAILGKKRSGKDTFSNYLIKEKGFIRYGFADPLKKGIQAFFNLSEEQLYDEKLKEEIDPRWGVSPRKLFQTIGTDIFQYSIKNYIPELTSNQKKHWVILFKEWYLKMKKENPNIKVIISDARFIHEIEEIKKLDGKIIKIIRPSAENSGDIHQSEIELEEINNNDIDYCVMNDKNLEDLYTKINTIIENIYTT